MTYIELIVVMGIFATLLSVAMYNHGKFQDKVAIKTLANDIALKLVEAQKYSVNGKWSPFAASGWKPSYGVYFNTLPPGDNRTFIYFADIDAYKDYATGDGSFCPTPGVSGNKCLEKISLNRGNTISLMEYNYSSGSPTPLTALTITFTRPGQEATFRPAPAANFTYAQITLDSPTGVTANIKIYPSGRIQIN